ncbi:pulmonary surfactant-associated protein D-like [Monodelphis domestica]|uniref:pulmonary surfactant-associated protein D-like n=1 Tax=Monodelphis domestica TaxID=13616 RepID=UPI0024E1C154|nr:pulmonary surfactant-associated protein D-like [Monodelphis domestica]
MLLLYLSALILFISPLAAQDEVTTPSNEKESSGACTLIVCEPGERGLPGREGIDGKQGPKGEKGDPGAAGESDKEYSSDLIGPSDLEGVNGEPGGGTPGPAGPPGIPDFPDPQEPRGPSGPRVDIPLPGQKGKCCCTGKSANFKGPSCLV